MDVGTVRGLITLTLMSAFIALVIWVYRGRNKREFDAAAQLPLEDDSQFTQAAAGRSRKS